MVDIFHNLGITSATFNILKVQLGSNNQLRYRTVLHSMISPLYEGCSPPAVQDKIMQCLSIITLELCFNLSLS